MGVKISLFGNSSNQKTSYDDTTCVIDVEDDYNIIISNNLMSQPKNIVKDTIPNKLETSVINIVDKTSLPINIVDNNKITMIIKIKRKKIKKRKKERLINFLYFLNIKIYKIFSFFKSSSICSSYISLIVGSFINSCLEYFATPERLLNINFFQFILVFKLK